MCLWIQNTLAQPPPTPIQRSSLSLDVDRDVKLSDKMNVSDSGALLNQLEEGCIGADEGTLRLTRLSVVALPYTTQGCASLIQRFSPGEHCDTVPK